MYLFLYTNKYVCQISIFKRGVCVRERAREKKRERGRDQGKMFTFVF